MREFQDDDPAPPAGLPHTSAPEVVPQADPENLRPLPHLEDDVWRLTRRQVAISKAMAAYLRAGGGVRRSARPDGYCCLAVLLADHSLSRLQTTWDEVGEILRINEKFRFQVCTAQSGATLVRAISGSTRFVPRWSRGPKRCIRKKVAAGGIGGSSQKKPEAIEASEKPEAASQGAGKRRVSPPPKAADSFKFPPDPPPPLVAPAPPQVRLERRPPAAGPPLLG